MIDMGTIYLISKNTPKLLNLKKFKLGTDD